MFYLTVVFMLSSMQSLSTVMNTIKGFHLHITHTKARSMLIGKDAQEHGRVLSNRIIWWMKYSVGMNMLFLQECGVFFATVHSKSETLTCKDCNKCWSKYCKQTWMFTNLEVSLQITPIMIVSMNHARKPKVMTKTQNTCKAKTSRGIFIASWQTQHNCVKWWVLLVNEVMRLSFLIHLEYWTI